MASDKTATFDRTAPELPMLEPTSPQALELHRLAELAAVARRLDWDRAAFILDTAHALIRGYAEHGDFDRSCRGAEFELAHHCAKTADAQGHYAAFVSLVSLAVEVGTLPNGAAACCGEIDAPRPRSTPQTAFDAHEAASERPECARALRHAFDRVAELARKGMKANH
jgi:hypothetical protein